MSDSQFIKVFQRVDSDQLIKLNKDRTYIWFKPSEDYIHFRNQFLTKREFSYSELWIVHEYYGDEGDFYNFTEIELGKNIFAVVRNCDNCQHKKDRSDLEQYFDNCTISSEYLLSEFKHLNDTYKEPGSEFHDELYQSDLDERIRHYLNINKINQN